MSLQVNWQLDNITVDIFLKKKKKKKMSRFGDTEEEQFQKHKGLPIMMDGLTHKFEIVGLVRYLFSQRHEIRDMLDIFIGRAEIARGEISRMKAVNLTLPPQL